MLQAVFEHVIEGTMTVLANYCYNFIYHYTECRKNVWYISMGI